MMCHGSESGNTTLFIFLPDAMSQIPVIVSKKSLEFDKSQFFIKIMAIFLYLLSIFEEEQCGIASHTEGITSCSVYCTINLKIRIT